MSTLLANAQTASIPRKLWTRAEAHQLVALGIPNAEKLELINGDLIDRMGKNHPHIFWKTVVRNWLEAVFGGAFVRSEDPIDVAPEDNPTNEPEPDLAVTARSIRDYSENPKPEDIRLVIEISDTTVGYDLNVKAPLYARAGIPEYWVLNIPEKKLIVHRAPKGGIYTSLTIYAANEPVTPLAAPAARFCLDEL